MAGTFARIPSLERHIPTAQVRLICSSTKKVAEFRDLVRKTFWPQMGIIKTPKTLKGMAELARTGSRRQFRLLDYGTILVKRPRRVLVKDGLRCVSMVHRFPFRYRLLSPEGLGNKKPKGLTQYIDALVDDCPNHLFSGSGPSPSSCKVQLSVALRHEPGHEVVRLARACHHAEPKYAQAHENTEWYFLRNDPLTVAAEIPVWLQPPELRGYQALFGTTQAITGHIDILRRTDDGLTEVWDYKPHAQKEKYAAMQVYLYAIMLSLRTAVRLQDFRCGYFDELDAYTFSPTAVDIATLTPAGAPLFG